MSNFEKMAWCLCCVVTLGMSGLIYVVLSSFENMFLNLNSTSMRDWMWLCLHILAVLMIVFSVAQFAPRCINAYRLLKNTRFLFKRFSLRELFRFFVLAFSSRHELIKKNLKFLLVKCIDNGWIEDADRLEWFLEVDLAYRDFENMLAAHFNKSDDGNALKRPL